MKYLSGGEARRWHIRVYYYQYDKTTNQQLCVLDLRIDNLDELWKEVRRHRIEAGDIVEMQTHYQLGNHAHKAA